MEEVEGVGCGEEGCVEGGGFGEESVGGLLIVGFFGGFL